jgi:hypothetical protein
LWYAFVDVLPVTLCGTNFDALFPVSKVVFDKFQAIAIGKKSMDKNIVLDLAGNKIKCEKDHFVSGLVADPLLLWKLKYESLSNCQQSYYKNIGYFGGIYT